MIILATTTDKLDLVTGVACAVDVHVSFQDYSGSTVTPGKQNTAITAAATTDILAVPAASTYRNAKTINIRNKHASTSVDVTVRFNQNATIFELYKIALGPGDILSYVEGVGWFVYAAPSTRFYADAAGNAADIVVTGAVDTYLVGLTLGGRLKTGSMLRFTLRMTKTANGSATPIWTVRAGTAGGVGDTARLTFTGGAQTGAVDTGWAQILISIGNYGASAVMNSTFVMQHTGTTTGFLNGAQGQTFAAVSAAHDLTGPTTVIGISVNPGAAAVWTHQLVTLEAIGLAA
jgi:hypothetical protein